MSIVFLRPMFTVHNILGYIQWRMHARDRQGHRIHSPFLYSLITNNLYNRITDDWVLEVERYRKQLLTDKSMINITDYGTGSRFASGNTRRVRDIARHSSTSPRDGRLLCNLATTMQCRNILELGTNLGLGTLYLAHSGSCERIVTIEGCPTLSQMANSAFSNLGISNITTINDHFEKALPKVLADMHSIDLLFIDGNHSYQPTIDYFSQCLTAAHNDSVFIIDDIHKDPCMEHAWREITENERVTLTLDFYTMGVVFFRSQLSRQTICLRY
ncbi:MAG: class I SAM-dependent methyltransferase [Salinivirgaceae bacterium]|nr:class I SAM-dependent methyltransferase [Salinivirgaceae bacterium]